ncbi:MAG: metallophosphoesterase [Marinobacter salarius]
MKELWKHISGHKGSTEPARSISPPQPEQSVLVIGDLHGSSDLLFELDRLIDGKHRGWPVIFLGDYIDRGEKSRDLLEMLMQASPDASSSIICLMGNHERMLLDFLDDPMTGPRRWLRYGGLQTLASFGVPLPRSNSDDAQAFEELRDRLAEAMGPEMITWLRQRPLFWRTGNLWFVHAGADPDLPMEDQDPDVLLWGHRRFRTQVRRDGQWVVHGHTIVETPHAQDGRIALDTGAYATGRLSAAAISTNELKFFQTGTD